MILKFIKRTFLVLLVLVPGVLLAQPANDLCTGAIPLTLGGPCVNGTNVGAADNVNNPSCHGGAPSSHEDVWYSFVATGTQFNATLTTGTMVGDIEYVLISGTCASLVEEDCITGPSPLNVQTNGLTIGTTYYVLISNGGNNANGTFSICDYNTTTPALGCASTSDNCSAPVFMAAGNNLPVCVNSCNTGNAVGPDFLGNNCYDFPDATAWFSVTAPAGSAQLDIDITSGFITNPYFTVFTSTNCTNFTIIDCIDTGAGGSVSGIVNVTPGTTYLIAVSDLNGAEGEFQICANFLPDASLCNVDDVMNETASSDPSTPIGGPYSPGEVVTFCYTINQYMKEQCNWLQGIIPTFGDCWDPASFLASGAPAVVTDPLDQAGNNAGVWSWWPNGAVQYNAGHPLVGQNSGAGWYFVLTAQGNDPDLTFGDGGANGPAACDPDGNGFTWTVCFQLIAGPVSNCNNGTTDCGISVNTVGDGEVGAWGNNGCNADTDFEYNAGFQCCVPPVITAVPTQAFCSGGTASAALTSDQDPGVTYSWTVVAGSNISGASAGSGTSISQVLTNSGSTAQTAVYTITANNGSCSSVTTFTVTVNPIPTVVDPADQLLCANTAITAITFAGNSGSTTYNWTNDNTSIGLAASGTGNIASFTALNTGITPQVATITVTPVLGTCSGIPQTFTITVNPVPTVVDPADQILCANQATAAVNFTGNSGSTVYNWTNTNASIGLAASGTGNIASFTALNAGVTTQVATITVTPVLGSCSGTPQTFTITVNPVPTVNDPADQVLCANTSTTTVIFTGNSGSTIYNWTNTNTTIGLGAAGSGDIASFTALNAGLTAQVATITVTPTLGTCAGTPQTFTITVNPVPTVNDPADQVLCANQSSAVVNFTGNSGSTVYNWTNTNTSIGLAASGSGNIASFVTINAGVTTQTATITVTPILGTCSGTPQTFTITVNPVPTVNDPLDQTLCANTATTAVTFTGNSGSTIYNWTNTNTTIGLGASGSGNIASFTAINNGVIPEVATITVTPALGTCTGTPQTFTITVNPVPTVNDPADQVLCANQATVAVTFTGNSGSTVYNWTNTNTTIGLGASGSGNIASFAALNGGSTVQNAVITVTPVLGTCTGAQQSFTITVNPVPTVNDPADQLLCAGVNTTAVTFTGNSGATTYNWINDNTAIGLAASGSGNIASFTATNAGTTQIVATITVTPVLGACTGTEQVFTVTVNPIPSFTTTFTDPLTCGAFNGTITLSGLNPSSSYNLSYSDEGTPVGPLVINTDASGDYVITGLNAGGYSNIIVNSGGCNSLPASVSLSDPSSPVFTISLINNPTTCGGTDGGIHIEGTGTLAPSTGYTLSYVDNGALVGPIAIVTDANGDFDLTGLNAGSYTSVTLDLGGCIGSQPGPINLIDPTPPTATASTTTSAICEGSDIILSGNTVPGATYDWTGPNMYTSTFEDNTIVGATTAATGVYTLIITLNNCVSAPSNVNITVDALPVISGTLAACVGTTSQLTATTSPGITPWISSNPAVASIDATGLITAITAGSVAITYTNAAGCQDSETFVVSTTPTVNDPADQTICANTPVSGITFTGNNGATAYTWTNNDPSIGLAANGVSDIASFNGVNAGITPVTATINVIPSLGTCVGTSQTFTITIDPVPTVNDPADQSICAGSTTVAVVFSGNSGSTSYDWVNDQTGIGLGASGSGTITSFVGTNAGSTPLVSNVTVVPTLGSCMGTSQIFTITVNPVPTIVDPLDQTLCAGANTATVTFTGNGGSTVYDWTNSNTSIGLAANGSGDIMSFISVNAGATTQVAVIDVTPTLGLCIGAAQSFTITVEPVPTVNVLGDQTLCAGSPASAIVFTGNSGSTSYDWTNDNTTIGLSASGSGTINSFTATNTGSTPQIANISVVPTLGACTGTSQSFVITVNPIPTVNDPADQTLCAGTSATAVSFTGNSGATIYNWTNSNTTIGLAANGSGDIASFTALNGGPSTITSNLDVTPVLGSCTGTTQSFTISVEPVPTVVDPADQIVCAGESTTIVTFSGNIGTASYDWTNDNTSIGLAATGSTAVVSFTSVNAGATQQIATITVTPSLGSCVGTSTDFTITVNPVPIYTVSGTNPSSCNGVDGSITISGLTPSTSFDVEFDDDGVLITNTYTSDASGDIQITGLNAGLYNNFIVGFSATSCNDQSSAVIVLSDPGAPVIDPVVDQTVCDSYALPAITGNNLSVNTSYWTGTGGTGTPLTAGDFITSSQTVYLYDINGGCSDEESFVVTINLTPSITATVDQTACESYTLPAITGTNISSSAAYYDNSQANSGAVITGPITTTQTVWIYDSNGTCDDETSFVVTITSLPTVTGVTGGGTYCQGDVVVPIEVAVTGTADWTIEYTLNGVAQTSTGSASPISLGNVAGVYTVTSVTDAACSNTASGTQTIVVNAIPDAPTAGNDSTYCSAWTLVPMTATGTGGTMTWYSSTGSVLGTGSSFTPTSTEGTTLYYVTETLLGCEGASSEVMITINVCDITLPTAFTPDGDGVNDTWQIVDLDIVYPDNVVRIYNRWGNLILEHDSSIDGPYSSSQWDGTYKGEALPVGSYYFVIEFNNEEKESSTGTVSILKK